MQTAQQWLEEASFLLSQGKKSEAIACYDQVLADTLFHKGTTLYELGRFDEAHDCLDQCITLEKKYLPAYRGKFRVLQAESRHECTIEWCDKAIEIDPYYRFAYNSKANALHDMKRYGEAVENYEKAISLDSNWSFPYNGMGNALTGLKKYDEAIEYYDKASELDPEDHFPLNGKAIALTLHRKYQEAKEVYDRLISLESEHPLYLCNRGRLLSALNKSQEAMNDFRKANEILKTGITNIELSSVHMEYIDKMLKPIMEIDGIHSNIKAILKNAKQDSPAVQKIAENVRGIEREQYQTLSRMFIDTNDRLPEQEQVPTKSSLEELKERLVENQEELEKVIKIQNLLKK